MLLKERIENINGEDFEVIFGEKKTYLNQNAINNKISDETYLGYVLEMLDEYDKFKLDLTIGDIISINLYDDYYEDFIVTLVYTDKTVDLVTRNGSFDKVNRGLYKVDYEIVGHLVECLNG